MAKSAMHRLPGYGNNLYPSFGDQVSDQNETLVGHNQCHTLSTILTERRHTAWLNLSLLQATLATTLF